MATLAQAVRRSERFAVPAIAAIVLCAVAAWLILRPTAVSAIAASGTIEATQADLSPKVQGRLSGLRVHDGQAVHKGEVLAVLEQTDPALSLNQAKQTLAAAQANASAAAAAYDLQKQTYQSQLLQASEQVTIAGAGVGQAGNALGVEQGATAAQIAQAQAQTSAAQSAFDRAGIQLVRTASLVASGDEPQQALDDARMEYRSTAAQLQSAKAAVDAARANRRNVEIKALALHAAGAQQGQSAAALDAARAQWALVLQRQAQLLAARAQVDQSRAAVGLAQNQVDETRVTAPFDGYVVSHNFEVGDLVSPGAPIVTIADLQHPYLYVYVAEKELPRIRSGMHAAVRIDGLPNRTFDGIVTEIGTSAEFTPENVQTTQQRIDYLVFRVKIQLFNNTGTLKPGLPADASIHG